MTACILVIYIYRRKMKYFPQFAYSHIAHEDEFVFLERQDLHSITLAADLKIGSKWKIRSKQRLIA